ncbi:MAG: TonB-dependent receptor plug domain-containing protein [Candidatus Eremiobacteraeota bacterium]|nr:TonB-dependent receptor plug domain-containing protein [Candidatus Eremiobacteraeota bacterium]
MPLAAAPLVLPSLALLSFAAAPRILGAQTVGTVDGRVTDAGSGRPLENAQVSITGTTLGAITNSAGAYRINGVPARALELRARLVGFRPATRPVTVVAGGAVETKKLGNTIAVVRSPENAPILTASEALQGREPGVVGLPSGGMTGEGARIRIRGNASLSQSNEPIIFVDGVRINSAGGFGQNISRGGGSPSRLNDIDPTTIDRIEILKGAAAATLYGTEASNGVIQIFTKRGNSGVPR